MTREDRLEDELEYELDDESWGDEDWAHTVTANADRPRNSPKARKPKRTARLHCMGHFLWILSADMLPGNPTSVYASAGATVKPTVP